LQYILFSGVAVNGESAAATQLVWAAISPDGSHFSAEKDEQIIKKLSYEFSAQISCEKLRKNFR
jgi:hypothetical protein